MQSVFGSSECELGSGYIGQSSRLWPWETRKCCIYYRYHKYATHEKSYYHNHLDQKGYLLGWMTFLILASEHHRRRNRNHGKLYWCQSLIFLVIVWKNINVLPLLIFALNALVFQRLHQNIEILTSQCNRHCNTPTLIRERGVIAIKLQLQHYALARWRLLSEAIQS